MAKRKVAKSRVPKKVSSPPEQLYIEGTEPYKIAVIDRAFNKLESHKTAMAESKEDYDAAREKLVELLEEHELEIRDNCGDRGYIVSSGEDNIALRLLHNSRLSIKKVRPPKTSDE